MKEVFIEAIEPIDEGSFEHEIGGRFRIRLSDGTYLGGVEKIKTVSATANSPETLLLTVQPLYCEPPSR